MMDRQTEDLITRCPWWTFQAEAKIGVIFCLFTFYWITIVEFLTQDQDEMIKKNVDTCKLRVRF